MCASMLAILATLRGKKYRYCSVIQQNVLSKCTKYVRIIMHIILGERIIAFCKSLISDNNHAMN